MNNHRVTLSNHHVTPNNDRVMLSNHRVTLSNHRVTLSLSKGLPSAFLMLALLIAGCSTQNKYEKEADKITKAVIANNMQDVAGDFDSQARTQVTRVAVARLSDELNAQGKYQGIQEVKAAANGTPGEHDFIARFDKHGYYESLVLDDDGKVRAWHIHMLGTGNTP